MHTPQPPSSAPRADNYSRRKLTRTCGITAAASILMVITAIGLSPLFPLGTARVAEPTPGVWVNWSVLGAGILAVVVLTVALALLPSWRTTRAATAPISEHAERVSPGAWSPRWLWLRPVSWVGVTHGLRTGKGASEVPVRASITAMLVAVTGLTGALTFGVSLEHLDSTPELYGWSWGAHIYDNGSAGTPILVPRLAADQWLSGVTVADTGVPLRVDGQSVPGADLDVRKGKASLVTPEGRTPVHADEIALGQNTMRQLHVSVGDQVGVTISAIRGPTKPFTVVGTTIAPWINQSEPFTGGGAIITHSGLQRLIPAGAMDIPIPSDAFVNFAPGAISPAAVNELRHQVGNEYTVELAQPPTELLDFGRVQDLPLLLALLLVGLAAVTLFLTLISSATRRRPELAILKAVGYRPNQLRHVVACQSTVMTLVGLVVGLPLGIALGRWLWVLVAEHLGLMAQPVVPTWQILFVALTALIVANLTAAWPGHVAARTPVARILREG